jgi:hypothetical protein
MNKHLVAILTLALLPACAYGVDGVTLINQSTVMAAGGFPYIISQPGSYKLTGNLDASKAGTNAIVITSSHVTIDLNGFTIFGPATAPLTFFQRGIFADQGVNFIFVRNGIVAGFGEQVKLDGSENLIEDLILSSAGCSVIGDTELGPGSVVRHIVTSQVLRLTCPAVVSDSVYADVLPFAGTGPCAIFNSANRSVEP